jgi:hypothetical protein
MQRLIICIAEVVLAVNHQFLSARCCCLGNRLETTLEAQYSLLN